MKTVTALIRREFIEHRGAFFYAPAVLLVIFALTMASALAFSRWRPRLDIETPTALKFFEVALIGTSGMWFAYLMVALFFYYADAFNADRRNNAMLFWKSMPVSDFTVLGSKMLSGLTLFPLLILSMALVTAFVLYGFSAAAVIAIPGFEVPGLVEIVGSVVNVGIFTVGFMALALLWYAPFFAWVGGLSTVVGRWSIPLAFLIPGLAILAENLIGRGLGGIIGDMLFPTSAPRAGYIFDYLHNRMDFGDDGMMFFTWFRGGESFDGVAMLGRLAATIDWSQMAIGIAFAFVVVYLASEYRRRVMAT